MEEEVVVDDNNEVKGGKVKKTITTVVVIAIIVAIILGVIAIVKPTPQKAVKKGIKTLDKGNISEVVDMIDLKGFAAWGECSGEYEDFADEYKDVDDDDVDEFKEKIDENIEEIEDAIKDFDKFDFELKEIKSSKKVSKTKNLYKVKAKIKYKIKSEDYSIDKSGTETVEFYLMKKSGKYYFVGVEGLDSLINSFSYSSILK